MRQSLKKFMVLFTALLSMACTVRLAQAQTTYQTKDGFSFRVEVVVGNLEIPWALAFASDGRIFVTERPGRVQIVENGKLRPEPAGTIAEVVHIGEGGLMGLALDPQFAENHLLYMCYTARNQHGTLINRVVRYREDSGKIVEPKTIFDDIPGARFHDGCRVRFGPDQKLYVTTGDAVDRDLAPQMHSMAGKILRLNPDGTTPSDNPFPNSPIFSLGHRNPQGLDWHPMTGVAFSTEHGPSGFDGAPGGDEMNLIEAGKNYGWPMIHHQETRTGMESPLLEFTPANGPASGAFYQGDRLSEFKNNFFFGAVRGRYLYRVALKPPEYRSVESHEALLVNVFGRIREVADGPDGALYFTTSNRDGRAQPQPDDDRLLRIVPEK